MTNRKLILIGMILAAATPTLFIPVHVWHHHDDDDTTEHEHCAVCLLPPMITLVEPATVTVAAPEPQLRITEQTPLRVDTIRWFPIRSRAPPSNKPIPATDVARVSSPRAHRQEYVFSVQTGGMAKPATRGERRSSSLEPAPPCG